MYKCLKQENVLCLVAIISPLQEDSIFFKLVIGL